MYTPIFHVNTARNYVDKKAQKLRFIGYTDTARNYKVWDEKNVNATYIMMLFSTKMILERVQMLIN